MKKLLSIAIGMIAACCLVISAASSQKGEEDSARVGKLFPLTSLKVKKVESRQPKRMAARAAVQEFPSITEITGDYIWSAYDLISDSWAERYISIYQMDNGNELTIDFQGWPVCATYDSSRGIISVESGQTFENDDSGDLLFWHVRRNEYDEMEYGTPLILYVDGSDLVVDPDDIILIGNSLDETIFFCNNNNFTDASRPYGYSRVGKTQLYSRIDYNIDIYGLYEGRYYQSTYSSNGYKVSLKVNDGNARQMSCDSKQSLDGIDFWTNVEQQGEFARISYILQNTMEEDATVSLGTHADVMIGSNDLAPITRRIDTLDQTYGLTMSDGYGAQLCVLFGAGLSGVSAVDDFWFGFYGTNSNASQMVGEYYEGSNYMEENGRYDSGMGWCWKDRVVPAGSTVSFSYLIGVGDVNLEPNFSFAVTPEDPDGWNNLSLPHQLTINGEYESPAAVDGRIEYAVEDSEDWTALTEMLPSGSEFEGTMTVMFDESKAVHTIRFRTVDNVGNTTMLHPIEYIDVKYIEIAGIEDRTYNGQPQTLDLSSEQLANERFTATYLNNVNAGTASFRVEGVFPYSIGRSAFHDFNINPLQLEGDIALQNGNFVFNNTSFYPVWSFSNSAYETLVQGEDYTVTYSDNRYPGTAKVVVAGIGNYTGSFTKEFVIDKAPLTGALYSVVMPDRDIVYDGNGHTASFTGNEGVGAPAFRYVVEADGSTVESPSEEGSYNVYMSVAEGDYYYGMDEIPLGSFSIFRFDNDEWELLGSINGQLIEAGLDEGWNMEAGITSVASFKGLEIKEGHVVGIDLSSQGLTGSFPSSLLTLPALRKIDLSDNNLEGNLPETLIAMAAQENANLSVLDTLKIGGNAFVGNLGLLPQSLPSLVYLDASSNGFEDLYPALPASVAYADISGQEIARTVDLNLSDIDWETLQPQIPTIILYDPASHGFISEISLLMTSEDLSGGNAPSSDAWSLMLHVSGDAIVPGVWGDNTYRGKSGDIIRVYDMKGGSLNGTNFNVKLSFEQGDANFFNGIDASDLQATILYAFGSYADYPFNFTAANTYEDEVINIQDVTCTVNILLSMLAQDPALLPGLRKVGGIDERQTEASITLSEGKVILRSERPVSALTVKASGSVEWLTGRYGLTQSVAGSNVVAYSLAGSEIPAGETVIGEYSGDAEILYASLSDAEAMPVSVSVKSGVENGVDELPFEIDDDCEIYDVMGIRHQRLIEGLNIIVREGKTVRYYNTK